MKKNLVWLGVLLLVIILFTWRYSAAGTNAIHLTAIGDSITYGIGDPAHKGYIGRVQEKMAAVKGISVELDNFGVPRYTTEQVLEQMEERKIRKQIGKADYIFLYIGTNDFRRSADYQFKHLDLKKMQVEKEKFSANLHTILSKIRQENSTAPILVLGLYHPYAESRNEQEILHAIQQWNNEIASATDDFAHTIYVPTLDLFINQPKTDYFSDTLHPNPAGYQLLADRVYSKLVLLEQHEQ